MKTLCETPKELSVSSLLNKHFLFVLFASLLLLSSCSSVRVASDYDKEADFTKYKTFAFYKPGIDKNRNKRFRQTKNASCHRI